MCSTPAAPEWIHATREAAGRRRTASMTAASPNHHRSAAGRPSGSSRTAEGKSSNAHPTCTAKRPGEDAAVGVREATHERGVGVVAGGDHHQVSHGPGGRRGDGP